MKVSHQGAGEFNRLLSRANSLTASSLHTSETETPELIACAVPHTTLQLPGPGLHSPPTPLVPCLKPLRYANSSAQNILLMYLNCQLLREGFPDCNMKQATIDHTCLDFLHPSFFQQNINPERQGLKSFCSSRPPESPDECLAHVLPNTCSMKE